ncbi:roundabout homolog 2-like [Bufo bufo]|uniref:roundabout homolog 2-like n=1 Tax=Bufo bufo TaxID=8384 RepID=UPI001ABE8FFE|nr:roundabout homolog 2-like [Bufo bufo]XP_040293691.1 roundabout homolog 2-like [Bufo bufo]
MKEKLNRFSLYLLFFLTGLTLVSNEKIIAEVGKKISLPCAVSKNGDITWNKDGALFAKKGRMGLAYGKVSGSERFSIASGATNNLETANVQLSDSGTFTCAMVGAVVKTVELVVFEVSAEPSGTLITSENLKLSVKSSPVVKSEVCWLKDGVKITDGVDLEVKNITIEQSGDYVCHIKMKDGVEAHFSKSISVKGFKSSPAIVYMSRKKSVTLPFMFNFNVKESPLQDDIGAVEGDLKYLSNPPKTVQSLVVTSGAACWSLKCQPKMDPQDLNLSITSPRSGLYQMEILLQIGGRKKRLHKDVCVANLTVSTSHNNIVTEGNVTLLCGINCIDKDGRLCWRHTNRSYDICGPPGKDNLAKEITVLQETSGNWTCGVFTGENRLTSANLTLEIPLGFLDLSNALFWVTVVAGVIVFLIIVTVLTVIIARHRRVRRARYRAWLLENLHHHRRCECDYKGFAPQRLRQNI